MKISLQRSGRVAEIRPHRACLFPWYMEHSSLAELCSHGSRWQCNDSLHWERSWASAANPPVISLKLHALALPHAGRLQVHSERKVTDPRLPCHSPVLHRFLPLGVEQIQGGSACWIIELASVELGASSWCLVNCICYTMAIWGRIPCECKGPGCKTLTH